jgi:hypothetical protein
MMHMGLPGAALAALALAIGGSVSAAGPELEVRGAEGPLWSRSIASPGDDWINALVPLRNGNVLGVGFVNRADASFESDWQAVAVELSAGGEAVSERRYGAGGGSDAFWSAAERADGNRVFAGFTSRIGPPDINGYVLVSRPNGTIIKENGFGHAGYDRFTDLAPAGDGFVFLGHSQLPDALRRTYIVKVSAVGQPLWEQIHAGPETWSALYIEPVAGGFVIAGGTDGGGDSDMFVMKVDDAGRELWRKRVGTPDWEEINHGLVVRPDGGMVLVGYTHRRGSEANDLVAATLTAEGDVVRLERFGGSGDERARLPWLADDGRIWVAAHTDSAGAGGSDALIVALGPDGSFTDTAILVGGNGNDIGTAILPLPGGRVMLAGYSDTPGSGEDAWITALAPQQKAVPNPAFRRTLVTPAR